MLADFHVVPPMVLVPKTAVVLMTDEAETDVTDRKSCVVVVVGDVPPTLVGPVMVSENVPPPSRVPVILKLAVANVPLADAMMMRRDVSRLDALRVATPGEAEDSVPIPVEDAAISDFVT